MRQLTKTNLQTLKSQNSEIIYSRSSACSEPLFIRSKITLFGSCYDADHQEKNSPLHQTNDQPSTTAGYAMQYTPNLQLTYNASLFFFQTFEMGEMVSVLTFPTNHLSWQHSKEND